VTGSSGCGSGAFIANSTAAGPLVPSSGVRRIKDNLIVPPELLEERSHAAVISRCTFGNVRDAAAAVDGVELTLVLGAEHKNQIVIRVALVQQHSRPRGAASGSAESRGVERARNPPSALQPELEGGHGMSRLKERPFFGNGPKNRRPVYAPAKWARLVPQPSSTGEPRNCCRRKT
jgi:hypothetical protein